MPGIPERFAQLVWLVAGGKIRHCLGKARTVHAPRFRALSDEEIAAECARMLGHAKLGDVEAPGFLRGMRGAELTDRDAEALALACEAFSRFPPGGLPKGAVLHDGQALAAVHLLAGGSLVQMDTGEGKTFALAVAAFALLRTHPKVYILTANSYLAARDAVNTEPFWSGSGVTVGMGLAGTQGADPAADDWDAQVIYTTISALQFRSFWEDVGQEGMPQTIMPSCALLDEADAVLLDQADGRNLLVRHTAPSTKDWTVALDVAAALTDVHAVTEAGSEPTATLTPEGEAYVSAATDAGSLSLGERLMLLRDVELAYAATRVAREGHNYIVQTGRVVRIDPATGWRTPGITPAWVAPLEHQLGLTGRPRTVVRHASDGLTVLSRFSHIAGASGTVIEEALEYMLVLGVTPARIPARFHRYDGRKADRMAATQDRVHRWVAEQVRDNASARPMLIATDSIREALELADRLAPQMPAGSTVRAVSDETIADEQVFEHAGRPGVTIVSTRAAGRGVDIQLTPEAREAGGTLLLALGHAPVGRLDRQLLGRVGRAGDPFSAIFITHFGDAFWRQLATKRMRSLTASMTGDQVLESFRFNRQFAKAQRRNRLRALGSFAGTVNMQIADRGGFELLREWRVALGPQTHGELPATFVRFVVDAYIAARFPALGFESGDTGLDPRTAAAEVAALIGRPGDASGLVVRTSGQPSARTREVLTEVLSDALRQAMAENLAARAELAERRVAAHRAILDLRLLSFARSVVAADASPDVGQAIAWALDAGRGAAPAMTTTLSSELGVAVRTWVDERSQQQVPVDGDGADGSGDAVIRELVASTASLLAGEHPGGPDDRTRLAAMIEEAEATREEAARHADSAAAWEERAPWTVASETIDRAAQRLMTGLDRIRFEAGQTAPGPAFFRVYTHRVEDLCRDLRSTLATESCANLMASADPTALDDLLSEREREVAVRAPVLRRALPVLPVRTAPRTAAPAYVPADETALMHEFGEAMRERHGADAVDEAELFPALMAAMEGNLLPTLTDPDRVAAAYAAWKASDHRRENVPPWRRRKVDRQVRAFFKFLYEKGLAAPLPSGLAQRSSSILRRIRARFTSRMLALGMLVLAGAAALALVLALAPHGRAVASPEPVWGFLDQLLTGGTLSSGSALGPALLAILGASWVKWMLGWPLTSDSGTTGADQIVSFVLLLVGAILVTRPGGDGIGAELPLELVWALVLVATGALFRSCVWLFERFVHIRLSVGLAGAFAAFAVVPHLARLTDATDALLVTGIGAVILFASLPLRRAVFRVLAVRVDSDEPDRPDTMSVPITVRAHLSVIPHASALAFAWIVSCLLIETERLPRAVVAAAVYLAVLAIWAQLLARSATGVADWQERMRKAHQGYDPAGPGGADSLEAALASARRRLVALELGVALPVVALSVLPALRTDPDVLSQLPVGVAIVAATVFAVDLGRSFIRDLRTPLSGAPHVETGASDEREGIGAYATAVVGRINRKLGVLALVILVLRGIADVLDVWDLVTSIFDFLVDLVS